MLIYHIPTFQIKVFILWKIDMWQSGTVPASSTCKTTLYSGVLTYYQNNIYMCPNYLLGMVWGLGGEGGTTDIFIGDRHNLNVYY